MNKTTITIVTKEMLNEGPDWFNYLTSMDTYARLFYKTENIFRTIRGAFNIICVFIFIDFLFHLRITISLFNFFY